MKVKCVCQTCGKSMAVPPSLACRKKFCSRVCQGRSFIGNKNPAYRGGTVVDTNGYVRVRGGKKRYEHQIVMEVFLGRALRVGEEVHHLNGVKTDNRPENLFVVDKREHSRIHFNLFIEVQRLRRENELLRAELEKLRGVSLCLIPQKN